MKRTIKEIAQFIDGEIIGNPELIITGLSGIKEAREGHLTFLANSKYASLLLKTQASAVIVEKKVDLRDKCIIRTDNPSWAFAKIVTREIGEDSFQTTGIHPQAFIADDAQIADNVSIGPFAVIASKTRIGRGSVIGAGCFIGHQTSLGENCLIYPNTTIRERIHIGNRVIIHSGTVIGCDGFGFVNVEGVHEKIPQIGKVVIEDDVEIGANVTVDRARFDKTLIGRGTKIDNLVQIAHNVQIGENCIIVAQVGVSGSTMIEKNAILAGQVGVIGHLTIGEGAVIAAQSGVSKSVKPHTKVFGSPAKPYAQAYRVHACLQKLPDTLKEIGDLKKKVKSLESRFLSDIDGKEKNNS